MRVVKRRWFLTSLALSIPIAAWLAWAGAARSPAPSSAPPSSSGSPSGARSTRGEPQAAAEAKRALPEVRTLHQQPGSAYHARLFADDGGVVLVTQTGFATLRADGAFEEHPASLGPVVARQGDALVFWRSGHLHELSLRGDGERVVTPVARPPQYLLASEGRLAWIHTTREDGTSLQALSAAGARVVHAPAYGVSAPVMRGADVYWVADHRDGSWHIERVNLDGKPPVSSTAQRGRNPAMLALGHDGVYFYDGPQRGVRRLTFDLAREAVVASGVICSPLVVAERVVCARVGGLFEISPGSTAARFLAREPAGPVTALALTADRALWVAEAGGDRLLVRAVTLPEL